MEYDFDKCPSCGATLYGYSDTCPTCSFPIKEWIESLIMQSKANESGFYCIGCRLPIDPNAQDTIKIRRTRNIVSNWTQSPTESFDYYYHRRCEDKAEKQLEYIKHPEKQMSDMLIKSSIEEGKKTAWIQFIIYAVVFVVLMIWSLKDCIG